MADEPRRLPVKKDGVTFMGMRASRAQDSCGGTGGKGGSVRAVNVGGDQGNVGRDLCNPGGMDTPSGGSLWRMSILKGVGTNQPGGATLETESMSRPLLTGVAASAWRSSSWCWFPRRLCMKTGVTRRSLLPCAKSQSVAANGQVPWRQCLQSDVLVRSGAVSTAVCAKEQLPP